MKDTNGNEQGEKLEGDFTYIDPNQVELIVGAKPLSLIGFASGRTIRVSYEHALMLYAEMMEVHPPRPENWNPEEN